MTIDKYIAIKWPHRAATYSTPRRAKLIVAVVSVWVIIYNVPHLFFFGNSWERMLWLGNKWPYYSGVLLAHFGCQC